MFVQLNQSRQVDGDNNQYSRLGLQMQTNVDIQYQQKLPPYQQKFPYNDQIYGQNIGMFGHGNAQKEGGTNGEVSSYSNDVDSSGISINEEGKSILSNTDSTNNLHNQGNSSNSSSSGVSSNAPSTTSSRSGSGGIIAAHSTILKMQENEYSEQNGDDLSNSSSSYEEGANPGRNNERRSQDGSENNSLNNSKSSVSHSSGIPSGGDNNTQLNFFPLYNTSAMLSKSNFASPSSVIDGSNYTAVAPLGNNVDVDGVTKGLLNFTMNPNKNNVSNENSPKTFQPSLNGNPKNDNYNGNNRFVNENGNASNENEEREMFKPDVDLTFLDVNNYYGMNANQTNSPL